MKHLALALLAFLSFSAAALADGDHDHDHDHDKVKAGPNGGRVIQKVEPHAEFLVKDDKKIQITFLNDDLKPVPAEAQEVTVTMGDRSAPTKLSFTKEGDVLVSDKAIPDGENLPTIVQIKVTPDAKAVTEKFNLNLAQCPDCSNKEYACTCAH